MRYANAVHTSLVVAVCLPLAQTAEKNRYNICCTHIACFVAKLPVCLCKNLLAEYCVKHFSPLTCCLNILCSAFTQGPTGNPALLVYGRVAIADKKLTHDHHLPNVRAGAEVRDRMGKENADQGHRLYPADIVLLGASDQHFQVTSNMAFADLKKVDIEHAPNDEFEKETLSQPGPASLYSKLFLYRTAIVLIILVTVTIAATATVLFTGKRVEAPTAMDVQNSSVGGLSVATSQLDVLIIQDFTDNSTGEVQSGVQRSALVEWLGLPSAFDFEPYNESYTLVQREVLWQLPNHISTRRNSEDDEDAEFISVTLEYNMSTEMRTMLDKCLRSNSCFPQVSFNETVNVETEDHGDISYTGLECASDFCTFKTNTTNIIDITKTNGTRRIFFELGFILVKAFVTVAKGSAVKGGVGKAFTAAGKQVVGDLVEEGVKEGVKKLLPRPRRAPIIRGCFPADTFVMVCDRYGSPTPKPISSVQISEKVLTSKGCSPVYLMGHKDPTIMASFVQATTDTGHIFELTPYHYIMANNEYVHASHLKLGDTVKVGGKSKNLVQNILTDDIITHVQTVTRKGLYNPYTVAGDILVFAPASNQTSGVVASVHSDWFLEDYVQAARVPDIYQALLAPVRTIHSGCFTVYAFDCVRALVLSGSHSFALSI